MCCRSRQLPPLRPLNCRRIENPRIVLLDCPLEYKKGESMVRGEGCKEREELERGCTLGGKERDVRGCEYVRESLNGYVLKKLVPSLCPAAGGGC